MPHKTNNKEQSRVVSEGQFMISMLDMNLCSNAEQTAKTDQLFAFWHDELNNAWALAIGLASRD